MMGIIDFIKEQLDSNQFLQGGVLLTLLASVLYFLRTLPGRIWGLIKSWLLFTVWFDSRDPIFRMFHSWVNRQPFVRKKRDVRIITNHRKDPPEIIMTFGYGNYIIRYAGVWMMIHQAQDKEKSLDGGASSSMMMLETYSITCLYWSRSVVTGLLRTVTDSFSIQETGEVPVYQWQWGHWFSDSAQPKKDIHKLILRRGLAEEITGDMDEFLSSSEWYESMQIPYQRGYLLTGPAGTGKTTLASCLASRYNLRLCILDMTDMGDDGELRRALTSSPGRSIVLIEDFDSFFKGRKNLRAASKVTFSGLLNAINGIVNNQGRILILTTNQESTVDPALARMGRIDRRFHLDFTDSDQASRLFSMYYPSENGSAVRFGDVAADRELSPADLAGHFQACRAGHRDLMDVDALVKDRDDRRNLSRKIVEEAEEELAAKAAKAAQEAKPKPGADEPGPVETTVTA